MGRGHQRRGGSGAGQTLEEAGLVGGVANTGGGRNPEGGANAGGGA